VWARYLTTGAVLAVTRVSLFLWIVHRFVSHTTTATVYSLLWLYPEMGVVAFWHSLSAFEGAKYYVAWCSLFTVGSFVMAAPILSVGWLKRSRSTSRLSR
jgi:hypothetical protein